MTDRKPPLTEDEEADLLGRVIERLVADGYTPDAAADLAWGVYRATDDDYDDWTTTFAVTGERVLGYLDEALAETTTTMQTLLQRQARTPATDLGLALPPEVMVASTTHSDISTELRGYMARDGHEVWCSAQVIVYHPDPDAQRPAYVGHSSSPSEYGVTVTATTIALLTLAVELRDALNATN